MDSLVNESNLDGTFHQWPKVIKFAESVFADVTTANGRLMIHPSSAHVPVDSQLFPVVAGGELASYNQ